MQRFMATSGHRGRNYDAYFNNINNNKVSVPIFTVYVAPIQQSMTNEMKNYFENFGHLKSLRFHQRGDFEYAFVQFSTTEAADKVLSKPTHIIGNQIIKVKAAHFWHQPALEPIDPLLIPPGPESESHILNALNEDCLREVFEYFNIKDLSNVANVCVRFHQLAKEEFKKKHKDYICINRFDELTMKNLFSQFGPLLHSIRIECSELKTNKDIFSIINQYCTSQLKNVELSSLTITKKLIKKLLPIFSSLEDLRMNYCVLKHDFSNLMSACQHVKNLFFDCCDFETAKNLSQQLNNLSEAQFCANSMNSKTLKGFIQSNPTITKLRVVGNGIDTSELVQTIGESLPNLVECEINEEYCTQGGFDKNIQFLGRLKSLKMLKLQFNDLQIGNLLKCLIEHNIQLEHFSGTSGRLNKDGIAEMSKMKQLKKLELHEICGEELTQEHLIQLAIELPQLEELTLKEISSDVSTIGLKKMLVHAKNLQVLKLELSNISIDIDDYRAMLKTIQNRPNKKKLLIEITTEGERVTVPEHIIAENRDILFIDEILDYKSFDDDSDTPYSMFDMFSDYGGFDYDDDDFFFEDDDDSEDGLVIGHMDGRVFYIG